MIVLSLFIIGHMELFFYTEKGSIISVAGVPTTDIIEPFFQEVSTGRDDFSENNLKRLTVVGF